MPSTILLMRHAEKPADALDPHLSPAGAARAQKLATFIPQRFGKPPDFIFATAPSKYSVRPIETVTPLSETTHVPIDSSFADQDYAALALKITSDAAFGGRLVLICWHHGQIPSFAHSLAAESGAYPDPWNPEIFNLILQFDYGAAPPPNVTQVTENF